MESSDPNDKLEWVLPPVGGGPVLGSFFMGGQLYVRGQGLVLLRDYVPSVTANPPISGLLLPDGGITWPDQPIRLGSLGSGGHWVLKPGVTVVFGLPGGGKTTLLKALSLQFLSLRIPSTWVSFGEPESSVFGSIADLATAIDQGFAAAKAVTPVVMVDSIKSLVYRSSGAAGARGVSSTLGEDLSVLHLQAKAAGLALILVVNPASSAKEVIETLMAQFRAGVGAVIDVKAIGQDGGVLFSDRENRAFTSLTVGGVGAESADLGPIESNLNAPVFESDPSNPDAFESVTGELATIFISDFEDN